MDMEKMVTDRTKKPLAGSDMRISYGAVQRLGLEGLVVDYITLVDRRDWRKLKEIVGLTQEKPSYTVYHGTVIEKVSLIREEGMKGFKEHPDSERCRISVTPSPTVALRHAIDLGPHDTARELGVMKEIGILDNGFSQDESVLLELEIPKRYLKDQSSAAELFFDEETACTLGVESNENTRLAQFRRRLDLQTDNCRRGYDCPFTGLSLPIDHVPVQFIFIRTPSGRIRIEDFHVF